MISEAKYREIEAEVRKNAGQRPDIGPSPLQTVPEIFGYTVEVARKTGEDESDAVEVLARLLSLDRGQLRDIIKVLKPLGYAAVCERLASMPAKAGKRKLSFRKRVQQLQTKRHRARLGLKAKKRNIANGE